ncbi:MAG: hypothetical protein ACYDH9_16305 [Limisphaerales bacterium]
MVAMATGMNYWDGQQWVPSNPSFEAVDNAFVAEHLQYQVRLNANLNVAQALTVTTRDGIVLHSTPAAIGLYDAASGRSAILAELTDCTGVLVGSNQVVYANAFNTNGVRANLVYTIHRGSFSQDVVITGQLNPADYGFPTNSTRVQIFTEFYDPPQPERFVRPIRVEPQPAVRNRMATPDLVDQVLGFGEFVVGTGRAALTGNAQMPGSPAAPVVKEMAVLGQRTFLVESVEYPSVQTELQSLPKITASIQGRRRSAKRPRAYAAIPSRRPLRTAETASGKGTGAIVAALSSKPAGLAIDYLATIDPLNVPKIFQGDTTYFVSGPVYCNSSTTIEGGAVFKYPNSTGANPKTAYIQINNSLTCKTSSYRPAIFTAGDDDNIGESLADGYDSNTGLYTSTIWSYYDGTYNTGTIRSGYYYANPALLIYYLYSSTMSNLRFCYAQQAVVVEGGSGYSATVADSQLVNCIRGIVISGSGSGSGGSGVAVTVNNSLIAHVTYPVTAYTTAYGNSLNNCTVDNATEVVSDSYYAPSSLNAVNSIFSNVSSAIGDAYTSLSGNYNGFYASPQFGANVHADTQAPFAPTTWTDGSGNVYWIVPTAQGAYYLRDSSPFFDVGLGSVSTSLRNDLALRTTMPPQLYTNDVISSQTLAQTPIRDTDTLDLGYHYPAVDYFLTSATVNNATLNIDPGTVLGFSSPYASGDTGNLYREWGFRLNPAGRLQVNGVPTNHVVFARIEAVQESPIVTWESGGPLITFAGFNVDGFGDFATPWPQANFHYVDFPNLSGWNNVDFNNMYQDCTYEHVTTILLDGCLCQGGWFWYDSGGPPGRALTFQNSVFERATLNILDYDNCSGFTAEEVFTAANNLFYNCGLWLNPQPAGDGANWTFVDNIFDHVIFYTDQSGTIYNGPVGVNNHNAYVGMTTTLSPENQAWTDPSLTSLSYVSGPLGNYYLPTTATALIGTGSRSAGAASLYHFTSLTSNAKQATGQVNMGPAYVALVSGAPADTDGDGIADFIEDKNGNGIADANESNWLIANSGSPAIVDPPNNANVSGIIAVTVTLGDTPTGVENLIAFVDGESVPGSSLVVNPAVSVALVEVNTAYLANGVHTLSVQCAYGPNDTDLDTYASDGYSSVSAPVTVTVANSISFPTWDNVAQQLVNVNATVPASLPYYTIYFYTSASPKVKTSSGHVSQYSGTTSAGSLTFSQAPGTIGYGDGSTDPAIFSFVGLSTSVTAPPSVVMPLPLVRNDPAYPYLGYWALSYADNYADFWKPKNSSPLPVYDPQDPYNQSWNWFHDVRVGQGGWLAAANASGAAPLIAYPSQDGTLPQTWPIRVSGEISTQFMDVRKLVSILSNFDVRNYYGTGHGTAGSFCAVDVAWFKPLQRFRFVFIDSCYSASGALLTAFGRTAVEAGDGYGATPMSYYSNAGHRPGAYLGYKINARWGTKVTPGSGNNNCYLQHYDKICNWHSQFLSFWIYGGDGVTKAISDAEDWVNVAVDRYKLGTDSNGNPIYFNPGDPKQLAVYGWGSLGFDQYNHGADIWP